MNDSHFSEGQASVSPEGSVQAGSPGAWTITYVVGESGLSPGDAVRVTVPTGFSAPQTDSPVSPGYVSAESGNLASVFRIALEPLPALPPIPLSIYESLLVIHSVTDVVTGADGSRFTQMPRAFGSAAIDDYG